MAMIYRRNPHHSTNGSGHSNGNSSSSTGSGSGSSGSRLTTTIPLHHSCHSDTLHRSTSQSSSTSASLSPHLEPDNNDKDDDDSATSRLRMLSLWLLPWRWWRRSKAKTTTTVPILPSSSSSIPPQVPGASRRSGSLGFRVTQILWLALLVYAFFGLPVLGRILNFCRYLHRFTALSIATGLVAGFFQDVAIFVQASTLIVLIKALFQPSSFQRRLFSSSSSPSSGNTSSSNAMTVATTARERYPHSFGGSSSGGNGASGGSTRYVHLPVYFPVQTNEYEMPASSSFETTDALTTRSPSPKPSFPHVTLVATSSTSSTATSFPWSIPSAFSSSSSSASLSPGATLSPSKVLLAKLQTCVGYFFVVVLVQLVVIVSTVASVADFCLQVTMHPRLNRAFVEIFVNYAAQFTASLMDEEVLTPPVVVAWTTYSFLVVALAYGFYTEKLPFLPDLLVSSSATSASGYNSGLSRVMKQLTGSCCSLVKRRSYRKDSSLMLPACSPTTLQQLQAEAGNTESMATKSKPKEGGWMKTLYQSYWQDKDADLIVIGEPQLSSTSSAAAGGSSSRGWRLPSRRRSNSSSSSGQDRELLFGLPIPGSSSSIASTSPWRTPKTLLGVVLHCIFVSGVVTTGALCVSLLAHTSASSMSQSGGGQMKHRTRLGVDMQLMANAMFTLETEPFFTKKSRIGADHINCTQASTKLLQTLGKSELFETENLGNDDSCALLWRKTTGFQGETLWDIDWNKTTASVTLEGTPAAKGMTTGTPESASRSSSSETSGARKPPNIIVLNMESWRFLDVGVLGAADNKHKFGKSATPNFDRFSSEGVLYTKHYTQCVQTTRTLLTTLFGMLPSCTETTALKMYGTGLTVRGLPQFLHDHGYFNMFWSAVDLSWEYWDKFLTMNGFDTLVDDTKIRQMLHEVRQYKDRDDDHFSWGMHDHLSFEMLLHAIESAKNNSAIAAQGGALNTTTSSTNETMVGAMHAVAVPSPSVAPVPGAEEPGETAAAKKASSKIRRGIHRTNTGDEGGVHTVDSEHGGPAGVHSVVQDNGTEALMAPKKGWEGLQEPFFIDMYTITSHNPWALPLDYEVPDLSELYTRFNKRYLDSMYFSDDMLGIFIDGLRKKGLMENTVVIIEGDHGYGRLEHDNNPSIADSALYDEATHVPFLILADDFLSADQKGKRVDQLTMQSDLMATIADIIGVDSDTPLYQHGFGHSMRRKRTPPRTPKRTPLDFEVIDDDEEEGEEHEEQEDGDGVPQPDEEDQEKERRVVLCNPFNGLTKGARTEELKYVFSPDGSYKVFALAQDPVEKKPVFAGYDEDQMDANTREMLAHVTDQVDLNQFLYETNKFTATLPVTTRTSRLPVATRHVEQARLPLHVDGQRKEEGVDAGGERGEASRGVTEMAVAERTTADTTNMSDAPHGSDPQVDAQSAKPAPTPRPEEPQ